MARRKKKNLWLLITNWLKLRSSARYGLAAALIVLIYLGVQAYQVHIDNQKLVQARADIDTVYEQVNTKLGQPANLKRTNNCTRQSAEPFKVQTICAVGTNFIYGVNTRTEANIFMQQIQKVIADSRLFKPTKKLSATISDNLVYDTYYHDALDSYRGPHSIDCSVKYSFDTPEEVDLSLNNSNQLPFEVFFSCSTKTSHAIYPPAGP